MKKVILLSLIILFSYHYSSAQNQILGKWLSADKEGKVLIYEQGGKYYGKLVWLKTPLGDDKLPMKDFENPDKSLKSRPLMNLVILKDFVYSNNRWEKGIIYDPESGKTYKCAMWLEGANILKVRGYWGWFYRTDNWVKVKSE